MAIVSGDVKLLAAASMADVPEGGGAPSGVSIPDGVSNAIFPDISELDRAGGRVNLRKLFAAVHSDDTDTYFGAHLIVAQPPLDPRVSVTLFATGETFDTRVEAQKRVEAYLNVGPEWPGYLYENHLAGQRVIQLFQRPTAEVPNIGQTLVLVWSEGLSTEKQQYVRATAVSVVERTFTYETASGVQDYQANIVSIEISDALREDFAGSPPSRFFARASTGTKVRDTVVADAGTYVGVVPLTAAAEVGDFTVQGASIYTQLVPSAQTETPIAFALPYAAAGLPVPSAASLTYTTPLAWTSTTELSLPGGCLPGSLRIQTNGLEIYDDGGLLATASGALGTIDYANGLLSLNAGSLAGDKTITYRPAAQVLRTPQSTEIPVTPESRSLSYVGILLPVPQPGTLSVSYLAQGRWYVLSDAGNGALRGNDSSYGVGTVNPSTGAVVLTLGALPDVGSAVVLTWNVPTQETAQPSTTLKAAQTLMLAPPAGQMVVPSSLSVTWTTSSGTHTATANAAGDLSGAATGSVSAPRNQVELAPNTLPQVGTELTVEYVAGPKTEDEFTSPSRQNGGGLQVTATQNAIVPGSIEVEWNTLVDGAGLGTYTLEQLQEMGVGDTVLGAVVQIARDNGAGQLVLRGSAVGQVNYATGVIGWNPDVTISIPYPVYSQSGRDWGPFRLNYQGINYTGAPALYPSDGSGYVKLRYHSGGVTNARSETFSFAPSFKLVPGLAAQVVPGSVVLTTASAGPWGDNGQGLLRELTADGWLTRGTLDYLTGTVALAGVIAGVTNAITRASCVTTIGEVISSEFVFRSGAAPLRPGSLSVQYARAGGGTQSLTAGLDGVLAATGVSGSVDYQTGLVRLRFGTWVSAAGNESQPWYDAGLVVAGQVFRPAPVPAASLRYSAVAYSYLPLDAEILGIDPVRLPSDGRVPIFRRGGFAVVGHTGRITTSVSNGQTVDCGRVRLSRVRVVGHDGAVIHTGYSSDLEAGTVTFGDITGYSQPVTIEHRVEDLAVVRDVQLSGEISLTRALTHAYPVADPQDPTSGSYLASALIAGDLFARVSLLFDQASWSGAWEDAPSGSAATGTFNAVQWPILVTNHGALTERWVVRFTSTTAYQVIGEHVGVIATGNVNSDCAPQNPATDVPYFTLTALGWGEGWAVGNVLRFNTVGAQVPVWVARTIQQGPETVPDDTFTLLIRGDVDTP